VVSEMLSVVDQNVLGASANCLEFEAYWIESSRGRETIHGLGRESYKQ
jgi:hypothetical protein